MEYHLWRQSKARLRPTCERRRAERESIAGFQERDKEERRSHVSTEMFLSWHELESLWGKRLNLWDRENRLDDEKQYIT